MLLKLNPATTSKQEHAMMKMSRNQSYEDKCMKVGKLIRTVAQLSVKGRWVYQLLPKQKRLRVVETPINHQQ